MSGRDARRDTLAITHLDSFSDKPFPSGKLFMKIFKELHSVNLKNPPQNAHCTSKLAPPPTSFQENAIGCIELILSQVFMPTFADMN